MITKKIVKELLDYQDGNLIRKTKSSNSINIGDIAGHVSSTGYAIVSILNKQYLAHRLIYLMHHGFLPEYIDHIDGDSLNNKIENLRECTVIQNTQNAKLSKANTSGIKGVHWFKRTGKWQVGISVNRKQIHLGYFNSIFNAACCIISARNKYHREFANHG